MISKWLRSLKMKKKSVIDVGAFRSLKNDNDNESDILKNKTT